MRFFKLAIIVLFVAISAACYFLSIQNRRSQSKAHHSQTLLPAISENVKGDFERENRLEYAGIKAEMTLEGNLFFMAFDNFEKYRIKFVVGDNKIEQYVAEKNGELIRLPLAYDLKRKRWLNLNETFFEPDNSDFFKHQKDWQSNCASCHLEEAAKIDAQKQSDCAACHSKNLHETENSAIRFSGREHQGILRSACFVKNKGGDVIGCASCHTEENGKFTEPSQQSCINCHQQFSLPEQIAEHTKHQLNSPAANCFACHQPEIVYGHLTFQNTHEISIPNPALTVEKGVPNACNLCHADKSVNWAIAHSKKLWSDHFWDINISNDPQYDDPEALRGLSREDAYIRSLYAHTLRENINLVFSNSTYLPKNETYPLVRYFLHDILGNNSVPLKNYQNSNQPQNTNHIKKLAPKRYNFDIIAAE